MTTNEDQIIQYVQNNARFTDYGDKPYSVSYKYMSGESFCLESFWSESPRGLVEQILEFKKHLNQRRFQ